MSNFFSKAWEGIKQSAQPWDLFNADKRAQLLSDMKAGHGVFDIGSPLHGLTAGYTVTKAVDPTYNSYMLGKNIKNEGVGGALTTAQQTGSNIGGAFKENWPAILAFLGGAAAGGGGGGGAGAGAGGGGTSAAEGLGSTAAETAPSLGGGGAGIGAGIGGGGGEAGASGGGGAAAANGFDWMGLLGKVGSGLKDQGKSQDELLNRLAAVGPPPLVAGGQQQGVGSDIVQQYQDLLPGKKPPAMQKTRGEALTGLGGSMVGGY